jgi:hypothetical protein
MAVFRRLRFPMTRWTMGLENSNGLDARTFVCFSDGTKILDLCLRIFYHAP